MGRARILMLLLLSITIVGAVQHFIELPSDTQVNPGEDALLKCRVSNKNAICYWRKNYKLIKMHPGKYEWASSVVWSEHIPVDGDCSLMIRAATLKLDNAQWQCLAVATNYTLQDALASRPVALIVRAIPNIPRIFYKRSLILPGQEIAASAGDQATFVCEVNNGNPPAFIEWYLEKERLTAKYQEILPEVEQPKLWTTRSVLDLQANKSASGKQLTCRANHSSYPSPYYMDSHSILDVIFAPTAAYILIGDSANFDSLEEDLSVLSLECNTQGNPAPYISWTKNGRYITTKGAKLIKDPVHRNDSGIYRCQTSNTKGKSESPEIGIDVKFSARVTEVGPSTFVEADLYFDVVLQCKAEGNPTPSYQWYYNPRSSLISSDLDIGYPISSTQQLFLYNVTYSQQGQYTCVAKNHFGQKERSHQSKPITLRVVGPPVGKDTTTVHAWTGSVGRVEVSVCAVPPPKQAKWVMEGLKLDIPSRSGHYTALEPKSTNECYLYTLLIANISPSDERVIYIHVENERGYFSHSVFLIVDDNLSLTETDYWAVVITMALVIGLLVIVHCLLVDFVRYEEIIGYRADNIESGETFQLDATASTQSVEGPSGIGEQVRPKVIVVQPSTVI